MKHYQGRLMPFVATGLALAALGAPTAALASVGVASLPLATTPLASGLGSSALPRGTAQVAWARKRPVFVYRSTRALRPERQFPARNKYGITQVFLVKRVTPGWLQVYLPVRPNDSIAWVRTASVNLTLDPYRVVVDIARHELEVLRAGVVVAHAVVGTGKPATPTPRGLFYIVEDLAMTPVTGPYGGYAMGLSGYSNVVHTFGSGNGQIALHGTNEPWTVGESASNGCVHLSSSLAHWLAWTLPLGTPVQIN